MKSKSNTESVVYEDVLNLYQLDIEEPRRHLVQQLYRKDKRYSWQKEYRIVLPPTQETPVFIEIGNIEDIAWSGKMSDLK